MKAPRVLSWSWLNRRICFSLFECALLLVFLLALARYVSLRETPPEWHAAFEQKYGPKESQFGEEWLIRDFFGDRRGGVFVDVGAADARKWSTTYRLEETLGWSGIAVEPQPQYAEGYARLRPRTTLVQAFVSDRSGDTQTLWVPPKYPGLATFDRRYLDSLGLESTAMEVPTVTLTELLDKVGVMKVDLLSMDIEQAEPMALRGFDIARFRPSLVCVEAHDATRQWLLEYFHRHGYVLVGRFMAFDWLNLYFAPADPDKTLTASLPTAR